MKIVVDDREPDDIIIRLFREDGLDVEVSRLPIGDYKIDQWIVERKTIQDFWGSWVSGHLEDQIYDMVEKCSHPALLIEGDIDTPLEMVKKVYKHARTLNFLIPVVHTYSLEDTALNLKRMALKIRDMELDYIKRPARVKSQTDPRLAFLSCFPKIDIVKAERVLSKYGTLDNAIKHIGDWTEIDGIGKKIQELAIRMWVEKGEGKIE